MSTAGHCTMANAALLTIQHPWQTRTRMPLHRWTFEFADYVAAGLCDASVIHDAPYASLMRVVDPKSYFSAPPVWDDTAAMKNFRAIPKLVVDGGNDEFMLPDDNHAWWGDLPGEKHLLHIANADHPLDWWPPGSGKGDEVFQRSLRAFYSAVVRERPRPNFEWEILSDGLTIVAKEFTAPPINATMWAAVTTDGFRDWRLFNCRSAEPGEIP
jgi:PhoPQ-activated pathogenicity-related protein